MFLEVMILARIKLVTDSTADIPLETRQALGIEMVPLKVHFGEETYLDGITLDSAEFYKKLAAFPGLPTTSQPSPIDFYQLYKELASEPGTQIISIHLSSAFSGTYQSAVLAKSMLEQEQEVDITIIDSRTATYGIGLLVVAAAEAARAGKGRDEIVELVYRLRKETSLYFLVDTLEYLQKGGRIGKASAVLGSLLNIKPILSVDDDGEVTAVDKVRGQKRAMQRIVELLKERHQGPVKATIAHADALERAQELRALIQEHFDLKELQFTSIGPVIGAHTGGGTLGVFMIPG